MNSRRTERAQRAEYVSTHLLGRTTLLTRLLARDLGGGLSVTEAGLLRSLAERPRRITALADGEGLAQPTTTLLVNRLEREGLVERERQGHDRRVVLVRLTDEGAAAFEEFRGRAIDALRGHLDELRDEQLEALVVATDVLQGLIDALLGGAVTRARVPG
jgi:DNA-binding MarR family transcriptional regulator